ncbi:MAG: S1 domain-containing RNA-binding protein [Aerococcus sp.]|nr:S1 domain-containing RNA-binding protein [Aerococcus sp.]
MSIAVGDKVTGKVTGITKFGAFVDINEAENGLVHISEVANDYVKDVHDYLNVGDEVTVVVTNIGEDGKIALSIKKAQPKPEKPAMNKPRRQPMKSPRNNASRHGGGTDDFDAMMSSFLKDSEDRLSSLKRNTEAKRGGRGGRRGR